MKKCCECNKWVWPWQGSFIASDVIHAKCHQHVLNELAKEPGMRGMIIAEIRIFERLTGILSNIKID